METVFESIMMICFGLSWPISVYKSIKSRSTKGKSVFFLLAILIGYIAGILGKLFKADFVLQNLDPSFVLYIINFTIVSTDVVLYFINRKREKALEAKGQKS